MGTSTSKGGKRELSISELEALMPNPNRFVQAEKRAKESSDSRELAELAKSESIYVRGLVAENRHKTGETELLLAGDSDSSVRGLVARTTEDPALLETFANDNDRFGFVPACAGENAHAYGETLLGIAVRGIELENNGGKSIGRLLLAAVTGNKSATPDVLKAAMQSKNTEALSNIARHPQATIEMKISLMGSKDAGVSRAAQVALCEDNRTPRPMLEELAGSHDTEIARLAKISLGIFEDELKSQLQELDFQMRAKRQALENLQRGKRARK